MELFQKGSGIFSLEARPIKAAPNGMGVNSRFQIGVAIVRKRDQGGSRHDDFSSQFKFEEAVGEDDTDTGGVTEHLTSDGQAKRARVGA